MTTIANLDTTEHITGLVTDESNTPIEGIDVSAQLPDGNGGWQWVTGQWTDADGRYDLLVPPGTGYRIAFWDPQNRYMGEWYNDAFAPEQAQDVTAPGQVNATLTQGEHITGIVTDEDDLPIQGINVTTYLPDGNGGWQWVAGQATDTSGSYDLMAPPGTGYRIVFEDPQNRYLNEWYNDACCPDQAQDVTAPGQVNATLTTAAHITGHVSDENDTPLPNIDVAAVPADPIVDEFGNPNWPQVAWTQTDANGDFVLSVPPGSYRIQFGNDLPSAVYLYEWYDNVFTPEAATPIAAGSGVSVDAQLAVAAHLVGHVVDESGNSLQNIHVNAMVPDGSGGWQYVTGRQTDENGDYHILLPAGTYFIQFWDPQGNFLGEWHDNQCCAENGQAVTVNPGETVTTDATLTLGEHLTGHVTDENDAPIEGIEVGANLPDGNGGWQWVTGQWTDANGNYDLLVPPITEYRISFWDPQNRYVSEWYSDVFSPDQAQDVTAPGQVNATLTQGEHITGIVTDESNTPIEGIDVSAQLPDGNGGWQWVAGQWTDADGRYDLLVPPGTGYRIAFWDPQNRYVGEWYNDVFTPENAQDVAAPSQVNVTLTTAAHITGHVTDDSGTPLPGISLAAAATTPATDENGNSYWPHVAWAQTDANGNFDLAVLAGSYLIEIWGTSNDVGYAGEWYQDVHSPDQATAVIADNVDPLSITLSQGEHITGIVTDESNTPIEGIDVSAQLPDGNGGWQWVAGQWTDADGRYDLLVPPGTGYRIAFGDPQNRYVGEWYNDAFAPENGQDVAAPSQVNVTLTTAAHITGQVTDDGGTPLPGISLAAAATTPATDENGNSYWPHVAWAQTDANGNFDLAVLAGSYLIEIWGTSNGVDYVGEWYQDVYSPNQATAVNTSVSTPVTVRLSPAAHIHGTITNEAGDALTGIEIVASIYAPNPDGTDNWAWFAGQISDDSGHYDFALPAGDYWIFLNDRNRPARYVSEWYPDAPDPSRGTMQTVAAGESITVDVTLEWAEHITGVVRDTQGNPLSGIQLTVGQPPDDPNRNPDWPANIAWAISDENGAFDLALPAGAYYILFQDSRYPAQYVSEYHENARVPHEAELVSTNSGVPLDVVLEDAGHLYVHVTDTADVGLTDMDVGASISMTNADGQLDWKWFIGGYSEPDGYYDLVVPTGTYWISARDVRPEPMYVGEWYEDAPLPHLGRAVSITAGSAITITIALESGAHISGTVTDESDAPIEGIDVSAQLPDANGGWMWVAGQSTDADGDYDLLVPLGSAYRIAFRDPQHRYVSEWYADVFTPDEAQGIVAPGQANATLTAAGRITGTVTDDHDMPVQGIHVNAARVITAPDGTRWWEQANSVTTDEYGAFDIGDLLPAAYLITFQDSRSPRQYISEYYDNAQDIEQAQHVHISVGQTVPDINAKLDTPGHITGTVIDENGDGVSDIQVTAVQSWTMPDGSTGWEPSNVGITDANGTYDISDLHPGIYRIQFQDRRWPQQYMVEYYDNAVNIEQGQNVTVGSGQTITRIDAELAEVAVCTVQPTPSYIDVFGSATIDGQPVPFGAKVEALNAQGDVVGCFVVNQVGAYGYMRIYGADPTATPPIPGMEAGQAVSFRIAGQAAFATPPVNWSNGAEQEADLVTTRTQSIVLNTQWNLVSFNVEPPDSAIAAVLNSITGIYDRVVGEYGIFSATTPAQYNTLHELHGGPSYYVRISNPPATVTVTGVPIPASTPITLHPGWNWISYLPTTPLPIADALQSIDGLYQRVISLMEIHNVSEPGFNTLHTLTPGEGYLIYMNQAASLVYPTSGVTTSAANLTDSAPLCGDVQPTPFSTFIYGSLMVNGAAAQPGTRVDVLTPDGAVAGCTRVVTTGQFGFMPVYGAAEDTAGSTPGFAAGQPLQLRVNGIPVVTAGTLTWQDDKTPHRMDLTIDGIDVPDHMHDVYLPFLVGGITD